MLFTPMINDNSREKVCKMVAKNLTCTLQYIYNDAKVR